MIDASLLYQKIVLAYVQFQDFKRHIPSRLNIHFSSRELIYMHDIFMHPDSPISACAKRAKVTIGTYTTVYKLLQKKGLVEIKEKAKDKRVKLINLTVAGANVVKSHLQAFQRLVDELAADYGTEYLENILTFFDRARLLLENEAQKNLPKTVKKASK